MIEAQGGLWDLTFALAILLALGGRRTTEVRSEVFLSVGVAIAIAAANAWSPIEVDNALNCPLF